jgi:hypothetical protein
VADADVLGTTGDESEERLRRSHVRALVQRVALHDGVEHTDVGIA